MPTAPVRSIREDEVEDFMSVARTAMLGSSPPEPEVVEERRQIWDLSRCLASFDEDGRLCGAARSFATELTVPGGALAAAAVSSVGVLPTHRRQGRLTTMMHAQLEDVVARGEPVAVLVAAEYPIYRRYGYGPSTEACVVQLDVLTTGGWRELPTGKASLVDNDTFLSTLVKLYDRERLDVPGHIVYNPEFWEVMVGKRPYSGDQDRRRNAPKVLWEDEHGDVQGAAMYSIEDRWINNRPQGVLSTDILVATSDAAERELVRFLAAVDWVTSVRLGLRPVDDALPLRVHDGRAAALVDRWDHVWTRVLDVPGALTGRSYATEGRLVLEVIDPLGFATGRFALDASPDGAVCPPTDDTADLVVPVSALGAALLGGTSWARLHAAGWLEESRPGAVARASALFSTPRAPWCAMTF